MHPSNFQPIYSSTQAEFSNWGNHILGIFCLSIIQTQSLGSRIWLRFLITSSVDDFVLDKKYPSSPHLQFCLPTIRSVAETLGFDIHIWLLFPGWILRTHVQISNYQSDGIWGFGVSRFQWTDGCISRLGSESFAVITRIIDLDIHKPAGGQISDPTLYSGSVQPRHVDWDRYIFTWYSSYEVLWKEENEHTCVWERVATRNI